MFVSRFFLISCIALLFQNCRAHESDCNAVCEHQVNEAVAAIRQELGNQLNNKVDELDALKRVLEAAISRRNEVEKRTADYVKELHKVKSDVEEMKVRANQAEVALNNMKEEMKISQERLLSVMEQMTKKDDTIRELESVGIMDVLMKRAESWISLVKGNGAKEQDL